MIVDLDESHTQLGPVKCYTFAGWDRVGLPVCYHKITTEKFECKYALRVRLSQWLQQQRNVTRDVMHLLHDVLQLILRKIELVGEINRPRGCVAVAVVDALVEPVAENKVVCSAKDASARKETHRKT